MLNDEKIIIAIRNRSEGAINETIDKYSKLLWSIIGKVLNNIGSVQDMGPALDIFQQDLPVDE